MGYASWSSWSHYRRRYIVIPIECRTGRKGRRHGGCLWINERAIADVHVGRHPAWTSGCRRRYGERHALHKHRLQSCIVFGRYDHILVANSGCLLLLLVIYWSRTGDGAGLQFVRGRGGMNQRRFCRIVCCRIVRHGTDARIAARTSNARHRHHGQRSNRGRFIAGA
ncbi:hypothetical protein T05_4342 [Trichinella murrelli]|uniref:Uncharacterized protein n=1 Tax=Trichinella murrelli TaxID=144512 RepID=A0A0V0UD03_9BILA|nr:hypothetical protein T05_4342 [Trichinella murrelli]